MKSPWSAPPAPPGPSGKIVGAFTKQDHVTGLYTRKIPEHFSANSDDLLMRNLIKNYALEGKTDGKPNGHFYLTKDAIQEESRNIIRDHYGFDAAKTDSYVQERLSTVYPYFDVLNEGFLDVSRVPPLLKMVMDDVELENTLQVQLEDTS